MLETGIELRLPPEPSELVVSSLPPRQEVFHSYPYFNVLFTYTFQESSQILAMSSPESEGTSIVIPTILKENAHITIQVF